MSRFIPGAQQPSGLVKGSNRKITPWAERQEKQHSIIWMIENAVSQEMLEDVLKFAAYQTHAAKDTRRRWADAAERKLFLLRANPPRFEQIPPAEGLSWPREG